MFQRFGFPEILIWNQRFLYGFLLEQTEVSLVQISGMLSSSKVESSSAFPRTIFYPTVWKFHLDYLLIWKGFNWKIRAGGETHWMSGTGKNYLGWILPPSLVMHPCRFELRPQLILTFVFSNWQSRFLPILSYLSRFQIFLCAFTSLFLNIFYKAFIATL